MFYTYIVTDKPNGTLFTGHTDAVWMREMHHQNIGISTATPRFGCTTMVWYETHETREAAYLREREIKQWSRAWLLRMIEDHNPKWLDISSTAFWETPDDAMFAANTASSLPKQAAG